MSGITLTEDEQGAVAFAVGHLIDRHGYSSIVGRTSGRIDLEQLYDRLAGSSDKPEPSGISSTGSEQ